MYTHNGMYSAIKKDKIVPFATTWMALEGITLSKTSQIEKDKHHMISLMWKINKHTDKNDKLVVTRGKGGGGE